MPKVSFDISMSLDGYIAGPGDDVDPLHEWIYGLESWRDRHNLEGGEPGRDSDVLEEAFRDVGAMVMGKRMFDLGEPHWGDDPPFHLPVFVVTHEAREALPKGDTTFSFVTDGVPGAVQRARSAAGERNVAVMGGAEVIQQCLAEGLVDDFQLHVVPVLLGAGIRLFAEPGPQLELEPARVIGSPAVTHVRYRVVR
jgi:dihydrofolate reductase